MTPRRLPSDAGVSLIEILVAISILAIVSAAVVLTMTPGSDPLREEADRLALSFRHASQEAIVRGQPVGFTVGEDGQTYLYSTYADGRWWPIRNHPTLARHQLAETVIVRLPQAGAVEASRTDTVLLPDAWFDPAAMTEPFAVELLHRAAAVEVAWTPAGAVQVRELG